jgi:type II secretory pathway component PulM
MSLSERWQQLSARERGIYLGAALGLSLALVIVSWKGGGSRRSSGSRLDQAMAQEKQLAELLARYRGVHGQVAEVETRLKQTPQDFDLFKHLNQLVDQAGIRSSVIKMDPIEGTGTDYFREDSVDMNIQKLEMEPLMKFLQSVEESPGGVRISQLQIKKRFDNSNGLDAQVRVTVYRLKEGT